MGMPKQFRNRRNHRAIKIGPTKEDRPPFFHVSKIQHVGVFHRKRTTADYLEEDSSTAFGYNRATIA
jgi:hypothetical protein